MEPPSDTPQLYAQRHCYSFTAIVVCLLSGIALATYRIAVVFGDVFADFGWPDSWHFHVIRLLGSPITAIVGVSLSVLLVILASRSTPAGTARLNNLFAGITLAWFALLGSFAYVLYSHVFCITCGVAGSSN